MSFLFVSLEQNKTLAERKKKWKKTKKPTKNKTGFLEFQNLKMTLLTLQALFDGTAHKFN